MKKIFSWMASILLFPISSVFACSDYLCETPEIQFQTGEAVIIKEKAQSLGSVVKIYEYLRNNAEYVPYHGARSSSLNTFLAMEGNDVDLASTLIAMYRSVGVKARYAAGNVKLPRADVANWLGVQNESLAVSIIQNQGINVVDNAGAEHVVFEHVWVEVLVNFANYRAGNNQILSCAQESDHCRWVGLDASFKLKKYKPQYRNLLRNLQFDYDAYYGAEMEGSDLRDKSPLEIFEEQALVYLRENHPGITLEDVIDEGVIVAEQLGLLPSSLPFMVESAQYSFATAADHDSQFPDSAWGKEVIVHLIPIIGGKECSRPSIATGPWVFAAVQLSTKRLTVGAHALENGSVYFGAFLDGQPLRGAISLGSGAGGNVNVIIRCLDPGNESEEILSPASELTIVITTEASPFLDPNDTIYRSVKAGGTNLVATGGETSNWSQVRRSYKKLMDDLDKYPLLDVAGEVYVDINKNGEFDSAIDKPFLSHVEAQEALSGGLLFVAQSLYYTRLREESSRYSRLMNIVSPVYEYVGLVTNVLEVEKVNDAPFAVMPGGLLIDLKGLRVSGSWEADKPETFSNDTFKFLGHITSALEHEVWQELTGYDAISTMRGIQFSLSQGSSLLKLFDNHAGDTLGTGLISIGASHSPPSGFTFKEYALFGRRYGIWDYDGANLQRDYVHIFDQNPAANGRNWGLDALSARAINQNLSDFDESENFVLSRPSTAYWNNLEYCGETYPEIFRNELLGKIEECLGRYINNDPARKKFFSDFDLNSGFKPNEMFYLSGRPSQAQYSFGTLSEIRNSIYGMSARNGWADFVLPSKPVSNPLYLFEVYIKNTYNIGGDLIHSSYGIKNESYRISAGGGYVPLQDEPVKPADSTEGIKRDPNNGSLDFTGVTFNNEAFTDKNLIAISNNDVIRTPSTVDPVSTVTGNMYHDETDLVIPGKGMPYAFTRTYNSNPTTTSGIGTVNPKSLPLSQGWTHSYNMKLVSNDHGKYPNYDGNYAPENKNAKTSSITFIDERGGESNFLLNDSSTTSQPTSPRASFETLVLNSPASNQHTLTFSNGVKYIFDSQGQNMRVPAKVARLLRIEDPYGNQLNFGYDSSGRLTSVRDNANISSRTGLTLVYYTSGTNVNRLRYLRDWTGRQWEYIYAGEKLTQVRNPAGNSMEYTYVDGTHLLKDIIHPQVRDGKKKKMTFGYYENGQAYNYIDQLGNEESLIYDLFRRRTRVTNPRNLITEHYYDQNGALIKLVEPDNGILLFENNEDGLRYLKYDAMGSRTRYSYNTDRTLTGAASNTKGLVTREQDAMGKNVDYDYDANNFNQIKKVTDKNGNTVTNSYYTATNTSTGAFKGKLQSIAVSNATVNGVVHANVKLSEYKYYADGTPKQIVEYVDPAQTSKKRVTDFVYEYLSGGGYRLTKTVSGSGKSLSVVEEYDALWRKVSATTQRRASATDATLLSLSTSFAYDSLGRLIKTTDPLGNISEMVYDANNQVTKRIVRYKLLPEGNSPKHAECTVDTNYPSHHSCVVETNSYDAADRLTSTTDVNGAVTRFEYDPMGNVTKVTNHLGNSLHYEYDAMGRRTRVRDENGYLLTTEYDLAGRVKAVTDANGKSLRYEYDALGRKTKVTTPEGRVTKFDQYDGNGNLLKMTDANAVASSAFRNAQGVSLYNEFDEFNRIKKSLNAEDEITQYTYDLLGNRTKVIDASNQTTTFVYNDLGQLIEVKDPIVESGTDKVVKITYDEVGNRLNYTDRLGEVTRYSYDKLNRLVKEEYVADNVSADKVYDQYGDLVSTSYGDSTYTYTYDASHRIRSKTDSRTGKTMSWEYDAIGNLIRKIAFEGEIYTYDYNSSNRVVSMSAGDPVYIQASYHYDPAGRLLSRILSNGAATLYNYNADGFLTSVKQIGANGAVIDLREYQHDQVGNITRMVVNGSETIMYGYDSVYRLTSANSSINSRDFSYTYDAVGNRKTRLYNGVAHHYIYSEKGNRLDKVRSGSVTGSVVYSFEYDANGSMTGKFDGSGKKLVHVDYDQRRLAKVMGVNNQTSGLSFDYDANAYRIQKQSAVGTKKYLLEGEHLESIYDADNEVLATYLRGAVIDEVINGFERNSSGVMENRTFHHDQVNSVVALSDHNGTKTQSVVYGPFGESITSTGSNLNAMKYTGREQDAETGLYYYRARYYDPEIGRFISEDPIGFRGGINFYAYVTANPLNMVDPTGNEGTPLGTYDTDDPNYHYYVTESRVCSTGPHCTIDAVNHWSFKEPAPGVGFFWGEAETGDSTFVILDPTPAIAGMVTHNVNVAENYVENLTVTNAHFLDPGVVRRTTVQREDGIYIVTEGEGVGNFKDLNMATAPYYWSEVHDARIRNNVELNSRGVYLEDLFNFSGAQGADAGASGGYVLYPSKVNRNYSGVYSK